MEVIIAVLSITVIDLVLSGDNAAVIGLAIKNLPVKQRRSAAFIGAGGAIILRVLFTILAMLLYKIPYLNFIGGVVLVWIIWKLLNNTSNGESVRCCKYYWTAIFSIIVADISMSFDNILGVAGAAHGRIGLIIMGLALSIPILVLGSSWIATLMNRYPIIIYLGGAVLIHTAVSMMIHDQALKLSQLIGWLILNISLWSTTIGVFLFGLVRLKFHPGIYASQTSSTKDKDIF